MSHLPPATKTDYASHWWWAWFAVWSPPVAWAGSFAVLMLGGRLFPAQSEAAMVAGLAVGLCGLIGIFVAVAGAVDSLLATLDPPDMPGRERARLALLSLFGVVFSLLGYGCLVVLGGFVVMVSPFVGLQV